MEREEAAQSGSGTAEGEDKKAAEEQPPSPNALKLAATDCLNNWIFYLQMLNNLCSAGLRLSQSLSVLSQSQNAALASQCQASWEELTKSTLIASHSVKMHVAAAMQDMSIGETFTETDAQRQQEHNQQIVTENLMTFINLQYQFLIAGCEHFGSMAMCPCCQTAAGGVHDPDCSMATLQQCFSRLYAQESHSQLSSPHLQSERILESPKSQEMPRSDYPRQQSPLNPEARGASPYLDFPRGPSPIHGFEPRGPPPHGGPFPAPGHLQTMKFPFPGRGSRSPLLFPLFPLSGGRRWSEAAAGNVVGIEGGDGTMRRWSMPWDSGRGETTPWEQRYLPSKLAVPTAGASQERSRSTTPEAVPVAATIGSGEGLAEAIQLLSCKPRFSIPFTTAQLLPSGTAAQMPWSESHEERIHRRMFTGMSSQRGNWQSIDVPQTSGMPVTEHYDIFPPGAPLTSRKSSSSTDSSSCLSIHSRSTTSSSDKGSEGHLSGPESMRLHTNFYSMWSGSEHLPFIRLPESQEPQDDSDDDKSRRSLFPRPT